LLALLCAALVQSYDRSWLSAPVAEFARREGVAPPRLSELKRRLLAAFEALLAASRRRGRRPRPADQGGQGDQVRVLEALLAVAADLLGRLPIRRRAVQERVVAAARRLQRDYGLSQKSFCQLLGIPERTLRYWIRRARSRPQTPEPITAPPPKPPRRRDRNRGRFRFEVTLPGVQAMADTTLFTLFGVPLRMIALQDPGERYKTLLSAARCEIEETAHNVAALVRDTLKNMPGIQLLTDQGTPYMAAEAGDGYDSIDVEHRPQKEGTPTEKSTLERAFRTIKGAAAQLLEVTNKLAREIPALAQPGMARPLAQLLVDALLTVYHDSRRGLEHPLAGADPESLRDLIADQRQRAHAEIRSVRLFLTELHQSYNMPGSVQQFIRAHRHHAFEDLKEAERRLRGRACRCIARACDRYFAGIISRVAEEGRSRRAGERARRKRSREERKIIEEIEALTALRRADPCRWLSSALDLLLQSWLPEKRQLLFGGIGIGLADARGAMRALADTLAHTWKDQTEAVWGEWAARNPDTDPEAIAQLRAVFVRTQAQVANEHPPPSPTPISAILPETHWRPRNQKPRARPDPSPDLRF
jgi:hypothetical protein